MGESKNRLKGIDFVVWTNKTSRQPTFKHPRLPFNFKSNEVTAIDNRLTIKAKHLIGVSVVSLPKWITDALNKSDVAIPNFKDNIIKEGA